MVEQIATPRNSLSTEAKSGLTMKFLDATICSTTLSAMCYLFYYTECSFLLVSFFFMILMPWISIAVVFKYVKLWYRWCVINKITSIFLYLLIFFCHFGVSFIQMGVLKWKISNLINLLFPEYLVNKCFIIPKEMSDANLLSPVCAINFLSIFF